MPRLRSHTKESLAESAMRRFWSHGFEGTSMDDLVKSTGVSRHGIYRDFAGKRELFLAALDRYKHHVVTPAFAQVEADDADLDTVAAFFEYQIDQAVAIDLPRSGCLFANTMTEIAPHDSAVHECVQAHHDRLRAGFLNALQNNACKSDGPVSADLAALAQVMVVFAQGLWTTSRGYADDMTLRRSVTDFLDMLRVRITL
ncbi:MAG: TetR/AcrR family transcriptional regulator [Gammaproteobacteria bacterium]|nr:TetR/AcrR family transcriptional regulator [Gammaproteobacteria bacterium]